MSQETPGRRRFLPVPRRRWAAASAVAALGLLAGVGYGALSPPMLASNALVVLPASLHDTAAQAVIARSDVVLTSALRSVAPAMSLPTMRSRVQVTSVTADILAISADGPTAAQAEGTANAVANSYVAYVSAQGQVPVQARLLEPAAFAAGTPLSHRLFVTGGLGSLLGALVGAIGVIALSRSDRRFRMK